MSDLQTVKSQKPATFGVKMSQPQVQKLIMDTLQNPKKAQSFTASITSAVAINSALKDCDFNSIITSALLGEALQLSPSPQLGQYYLIPFNITAKDKDGKAIYLLDDKGQKIPDLDYKGNVKKYKGYTVYKKKKTMQAQFQLGYKGYLQLAIRSGQYKYINVVSVKDGELVNYDVLTEEITLNPIMDELERENSETTGYYATFQLMNGFRKSIYWSKDKMERHADTYSQGYKARKGDTFWEKDFDGMAHKTMIRSLISKWGIMSVDMQQAVSEDLIPIHNTDENVSDKQTENNTPLEPTEVITEVEIMSEDESINIDEL